MDTSGEISESSEQTLPFNQLDDIDQLKAVYAFQGQNVDTSASRGLHDRKVKAVNDILVKGSDFMQKRAVLFYGVLLGTYLVSQSVYPEYRIDKSPTIDFSQNYESWKPVDEELCYSDNYINDQPNYSHNEVYSKVKKLGLPVSFGL